MKVVTADEMKRIDKKTIEDYGIPGSVLMQRAGNAVANRIKETFSSGKVIVLAGGGNNGGDGIIAGRVLYSSGWIAKILLISRQDKLSPDCERELSSAKKIGIPVEFRTHINEKDLNQAVVIDAIFGTGLSKPIKGDIADVISIVNNSAKDVVSVDIPSGISSDTGEVMGIAIKATLTVTFGLPKRGHFLYPGAEHTGRLFVEDIGFPKELLIDKNIMCETIEKENISIPQRHRYSHKGTYGHVLLVGGSRGKTGAPLMAGRACLRAGAGILTIAVPNSIMDVMQARVTEEMTFSLPEGDGRLLSKALNVILKFLNEKADVLAIGPGIRVTKEIERLIQELLLRCTKPMVLDAGAIDSLKRDLLKNIKAPLILTPHPGEMARLLKVSVKDIERDRIGIALSFLKGIKGAIDIVLVLKGVPTIVAGKNKGAFINTTGNPGMAKAGSGDVLTGMLAGLLAQGLSPLQTSLTGVYLHGLAGDIGAEKKGYHSLLAGDIISAISEAFCKVKTD